jgi:hypothetical protein
VLVYNYFSTARQRRGKLFILAPLNATENTICLHLALARKEGRASLTTIQPWTEGANLILVHTYSMSMPSFFYSLYFTFLCGKNLALVTYHTLRILKLP